MEIVGQTTNLNCLAEILPFTVALGAEHWNAASSLDFRTKGKPGGLIAAQGIPAKQSPGYHGCRESE